MRTIILAQGENTRWLQSIAAWNPGYDIPGLASLAPVAREQMENQFVQASARIKRIRDERLPKHLLPIGGETNLGRTVRLAMRVGLPKPIVVAHQWYKEWLPANTNVYTYPEVGVMASSLLALWPDKAEGVAVLYGDVVFGFRTLALMAMRLCDPDDEPQASLPVMYYKLDGSFDHERYRKTQIHPAGPVTSAFFGRLDKNLTTGKTDAELCGFVISPGNHEWMRQVLAELDERHKKDRYHPAKGLLWPWPIFRTFLKVGRGDPRDQVATGRLVLTDDYTDDCDSFPEYCQFWPALERAALEDPCLPL